MENKDFTIYINKEWINGNSCLFPITNFSERLQAKSFITKKRSDFIEKLRGEGFNVVLDREEIDANTICLVMDEFAVGVSDSSLSEWKKLFDKKIFESAGKNFNYPYSLSVKDYFNNPFFPAVFKNEMTNGGDDKFLIENIDQLEIMKSFYDKYYNDSKYQMAFDCSIFQQYIENPGEHYAYLRVLVGASGDVLGASLKYSTASFASTNKKGLFDKVFLDDKSLYFINARKMFNYYSGGGNISFNQPSYSFDKTRVLEDHGFDVDNLSLPDEVLDVCSNIMENNNREIGVLCGIDFMLNKNDGKWYYLENQGFPAIEEWAQAKGIRISDNSTVKGYLKYLELELQPRYEALKLLVEKRKCVQNSDNKILVKKTNN